MTLGHGPDAPAGAGAAGVLALAALAGYLLAALREGRDPPGWNRWRTVSFAAGILLLLGAFHGPVATADGFAGHVLQHLLLGMLAPLALVLGAPVTLLLRTVDAGTGRAVVRLLRSRPAHLMTHPVVVLVTNVGGLYLLYLTPLYRAALAHGTVHDLVHLHFLASGYLFSWVVAGPDPGPRRAPVRARLVLLGVAVVGHATLSQLMYAGLLVQVPGPGAEVRLGATLMYYGSDLAEILLALAMLARWRSGRPSRPRAPDDPGGGRPAGEAGTGDGARTAGVGSARGG